MPQAQENSSTINRFDALFSLLKEVEQQLRKILNFQHI
jgi:RNAse (barnase) inhibitor barstar